LKKSNLALRYAQESKTPEEDEEEEGDEEEGDEEKVKKKVTKFIFQNLFSQKRKAKTSKGASQKKSKKIEEDEEAPSQLISPRKKGTATKNPKSPKVTATPSK